MERPRLESARGAETVAAEQRGVEARWRDRTAQGQSRAVGSVSAPRKGVLRSDNDSASTCTGRGCEGVYIGLPLAECPGRRTLPGFLPLLGELSGSLNWSLSLM